MLWCGMPSATESSLRTRGHGIVSENNCTANQTKTGLDFGPALSYTIEGVRVGALYPFIAQSCLVHR